MNSTEWESTWSAAAILMDKSFALTREEDFRNNFDKLQAFCLLENAKRHLLGIEWGYAFVR